MNTPKHTIEKKFRLQWTVSSGNGRPVTIRDLQDGIRHALGELHDRYNLENGYDDSLMVEAGDENEIILYRDVEEDEVSL